jgi:hypothetical protein
VKAVVTIGLRINLLRLENDRYQALKTAVLSACIPVHNLAFAEAIILTAKQRIAADRNRILLNELAKPTAYFKGPNQNEQDTNTAAANLRAIGPDASPTALKIAEIHNQLVADVLSGKGQSDALLKNVSDFADEAKALKDAINSNTSTSSASAASGS